MSVCACAVVEKISISKRNFVQIYDPAKQRYEVPLERPRPNDSHPYSAFNVQFTHEPFGMSVGAEMMSNPM